MSSNDDYREFLAQVSSDTTEEGSSPLVEIYHKVRRIPYGAAGQRNPQLVYRNNVGSCSGKHILLRDLLRFNGYGAGVATIFTDFNKGIPDRQEFPEELRRMIRDEEVCDFHHFVRVETDQGSLRLDATWHDALAAYDFPVSTEWNGGQDTRLAAEVLREYEPVEDIAALKVELLDGLSESQRETRKRFFDLLTGWIAENAAG